MILLEANKTKKFVAILSENKLPLPRHQISQSFIDGIYGKAYIGDSGSAVIVGDFVELAGAFDQKIYNKIAEIQEAHLYDPPKSWLTEIQKRYNGKLEAYTRMAFHPMTAENAAKAGSSIQEETSLVLEGQPVAIKPIDDSLVSALYSEEWSMDLVANTMLHNENDLQGFGFAATIGNKIIGGIGCYTFYRKGIEIQVDTREGYRRQGIATRVARRMLTECGRRNLECHWDAMNAESTRLAEKLGFVKMKEYPCIMMSHE